MIRTDSVRCEHFDEIRGVVPGADGCEECVALGETWNELRVCLTCGHVGCCEDSEHAHALAHFQSTGHPLIAPLDRGEEWTWCYAHKSYFDALPGNLSARSSGLGSLFRRLFNR